MTNKKEFIKVNIEDLIYAKEFFDNVSDYSLWLYAVTEYYQGNEITIKKKIVKKYFDNYKKTMNIVIQAKEFGKQGALKRIEKQQVNIDTLEDPLQDSLEDTLRVNNKDKSKDKYIYRRFKHLSISVEEFNKLCIDYTKQQIDDILDQIENYSQNKKFSSLYLTAKNWLKRNEKQNEITIVDPLVEYVNKQLGL
jgi:hypothetical protein